MNTKKLLERGILLTFALAQAEDEGGVSFPGGVKDGAILQSAHVVDCM